MPVTLGDDERAACGSSGIGDEKRSRCGRVETGVPLTMNSTVCGRDPVSLCLILCVLTARHPDEWSRPAGLPASTTTAAISAGTSGHSTNPIRSFSRSRSWMEVSHGLSASF